MPIALFGTLTVAAVLRVTASTHAADHRWTTVERVLHTFQGRSDGANPYSGLVADANGTLYGVTQNGGAYHGGTVFKFGPPGLDYAVLHRFRPRYHARGYFPVGPLSVDRNGALYGMTLSGGLGKYSGAGTAFKLSPSGHVSGCEKAIAVGTSISARPPRRSGRAAFPHPAPTLGD